MDQVRQEVLILVLMEDTLEDSVVWVLRQVAVRLNPCFNGRYSRSRYKQPIKYELICLNPCFNGRYSRSLNTFHYENSNFSLNPCFNGRYSRRLVIVSFWELLKS